MVDLENVWQQEDINLLHALIEKHCTLTNSSRARHILDQWREIVGKFVKVMPIDYRKALERMKEAQTRHDEFTPATEEVFNG